MPYVESPLDRIVNVHWGGGPVIHGVGLNWIARPDDFFPIYVTGTTTVMSVIPVNLPALSRTTLTVPVPFSGEFFDQVYGSFPDGSTGTINGLYDLGQGVVTGSFAGDAGYSTDATSHPFGGARSVEIKLTISLRPLTSGAAFNWDANAFSGGGSVSMRISGTAPSGGTIHLKATMGIEPPSVSLEPV